MQYILFSHNPTSLVHEKEARKDIHPQSFYLQPGYALILKQLNAAWSDLMSP